MTGVGATLFGRDPSHGHWVKYEQKMGVFVHVVYRDFNSIYTTPVIFGTLLTRVNICVTLM